MKIYECVNVIQYVLCSKFIFIFIIFLIKNMERLLKNSQSEK